MKKYISLLFFMFLVISILLPVYSTAQIILTLEDSTGNRISASGVIGLALGTDNNLIISLDRPFNFTGPLIQFVTNFYTKILGQSLPTSDTWISALKNQTKTGEDIATAFFLTAQEGQNLTDDQFVILLYQVLLMRDPDVSGLNFWTRINLSREQKVRAFVYCAEFATVCSALGIKTHT